MECPHCGAPTVISLNRSTCTHSAVSFAPKYFFNLFFLFVRISYRDSIYMVTFLSLQFLMYFSPSPSNSQTSCFSIYYTHAHTYKHTRVLLSISGVTHRYMCLELITGFEYQGPPMCRNVSQSFRIH